jgi:1-phosphofructokinase
VQVPVKSTVGAGDAMVAALAYALDNGYPFERAAILAVSAGTASVMTFGTQACRLEEILNIEKQLTYEYLAN